ncbi:MAG: helix-turn-helix domain-containing protein [Chloroflexi bacterium]|nr:MAG: helix-turn-helix domain-containing protein [Chloroflexota bacterium]
MDYSFGNWVKRRRKAIDLTQQELAQRVGCSPATIVKIESDERRPSRQMAELLAQFLEIPPEQREQFLKVARKEKSPEALGEVEIPDTAQPLPRPKTQFLRSPEPLIGREFELAEITRFIKDPKCRLLTLTGAGGIGKTRLALEAVAQLQTDFEYGAIFIHLAPLSGRDQIVTAIADALGFVLYSASDRSVQLIAHLHNKELLLVLDNFEHLLNQKECTSLPGDLLQGAPLVKLLVSSREPLQLQAEWVFEVRGLPVPGIDKPNLVETSSAVKLFVQRAQQTRAGFEPTPKDRAAIRQICQLVDGMPLAIEMAAAWTRTLSCSEIAHEIQSNINFLTTSARDVTERHRSIRATLDYSWKLLSAEEQTALRRLSVFKGGFTREAAEYVAGADLSALSGLVAKSLLHRTESGRYDLHELVRQFSLDYLLKNESEYVETQDRHSEYYSQLLQRRGDGFKSMDQPRVGAELAAEIANLRQAWRWAGERGQALQVGQAADTLFWLYESRCDCREGVPLFGYVAKSLEVGSPSARGAVPDPDQIHDIARARVMAYQGFFCLRQGRHPQSRELLQKSLEILRPLAQGGSSTAEDALPYTLAFLGMVTAALGDYAGGSRHLYEGLEMKRASNDLWGIAFCLRQLGLLAYYQGAYDEAHRLLRESLDVSRAIGNSWAVAYSLDFLGTAAYAQGAYAEAERFLREGLALSQAVGDRFTTAYALNGLGLVKKALGDYAEGRQQLEDSIAIWREIGDQGSLAQSLNNLGDVLLEMDNGTEARKCFLEALAVAKSAGLVPVMLDALFGSASLRATEGSMDFALRTLAFIKDHPAGIETTKKRAERLYSQLQSELPMVESRAGTQTFGEEVFHQLVDEVLGR